MSIGWIALALAVAVYALRLSGFLLADVGLPQGSEQALAFVPVATLTALIAASLAGRPDEGLPRLLALGAAVVAARRSGRAWICLLAGLTVYWLLRLI